MAASRTSDSECSPVKTRSGEGILAAMVFLAALLFYGWSTHVGWENLNLPGVEFRQTQTALSAYFIQRDHDFSLAYPTPVLGKPWSVPIEFPLYQWSVVWLSNAAGLELTKAGRTVSLLCFYFSLPALFLLLRRVGLTTSRSLIVLSFVLTCPLYIFYGRAFLIETMALLFSLWFLLGYLNAVEKRSFGWWVLAGLCGAAAGLVKITTFVFILMPACIWTVHRLWQTYRAKEKQVWRELGWTIAWALGTVALPLLISEKWLRFADATKALNSAAGFLLSGQLNSFVFGTVADHFSGSIWRQHRDILFHSIATWWVLAIAAAAGLMFGRRWWWWIVALLGCFAGVQALFPVLYALHEYYYVASAFMLLVAVGLAASSTLDSRLPAVVVWSFILILQAGQIVGYFRGYYPEQKGASTGGSAITQMLRVATEPDDVLLIAGQDWCSNSPYFARRRALMLRSGIEKDEILVSQYFAALHGESVGALVLAGDQRDNQQLLSRAVQEFGIDPRPVFKALDATVYFPRRLRLAAIALVPTIQDASSVELMPDAKADAQALVGHEVELNQFPVSYGQKFAGMSPLPFKYFTTFGLNRPTVEGRDMFFAHPITRLWFKVPAGRHAILVEALLSPAAYADSLPMGDRSDGFGLKVSVETPSQVRREIIDQWINPRDRSGDRGLKTFNQEFELAEGETIVVETDPGPQQSMARDWAMLGRIEIK